MFSGGGLHVFKVATAGAAGLAIFLFPFNSIWSILFRLSDVGPGLESVIQALIVSVLFFFLALGLGTVTRLIGKSRARREAAQFRADFDAAIAAGTPPPAFSLYLRPFVIDRRTSVPKSAIWLGALGFFVPMLDFLWFFSAFIMMWRATSGVTIGDVEGHVATATKRYGRLVAIGNEEEVETAGVRLTSDDASWQTLAAALLEHARMIVIAPAASKGTLWEIETIFANRYTDKAIFLYPPKAAFAERGDFDGLHIEWERVGEALKRLGANAPPTPSDKGALWVYASNPPTEIAIKGVSWAIWDPVGAGLKAAFKKARDLLPSLPTPQKFAERLRLRSRHVGDFAWQWSGRLVGVGAVAFVAFALLGASIAAPGAMPRSAGGYIGELLMADQTRARREFEAADQHRREMLAGVDDAQRRFFHGETVTREEVDLLMREGLLWNHWHTIADEAPDVVTVFEATLPAEMTAAIYNERVTSYVAALRPYVLRSDIAAFNHIAAAEGDLLRHLQAHAQFDHCAQVVNGGIQPETVQRSLAAGASLELISGIQQRILIAGASGKYSQDVLPVASEQELAAYHEALLVRLTPEQRDVMNGVAPPETLSAESICAVGIATSDTLMTLEPALRARVYANFFQSLYGAPAPAVVP